MKNLEVWKQSGNYFNYRNLPVFYRLSDTSRKTVLCLHGFPTSSRDYHKIWNSLAENFSILSFDMIGYGFSAKPNINFDYTTFDQVDVLQALMENLSIKKTHILAHDYGNTIVQELVALHEEKRLNFAIQSICMLNGALFPETNRPLLAQKILLSPLGFLFGKFISDESFKKRLASVFGAETQPTETELNEFLEIFKFNNGRRVAHKLIRYMREREKYRERWVAALQKMDVPFRFINGSADPVSGSHLVQRFREIVPQQKDIIELAGIGHYPHLEAPEMILKLFFEFHRKI